MLEQRVGGYLIVIETADELNEVIGKRDMGVIKVYDCGNVVGEREELVDSAWITISKNGIARLERVQ